MSALAMILTAAMAIPGNGPEKVSGEMVRELEPLNLLRGTWEGIWVTDKGTDKLVCNKIRFDLPTVQSFENPWEIIDEGMGRIRINWLRGSSLGTYRQNHNHLILCFQSAALGRLTSYRAGKNQELIIIRRVKSGK